MSAGIWTQIFHTTTNPTGTGASGDDRLELVIWKPVLELEFTSTFKIYYIDNWSNDTNA